MYWRQQGRSRQTEEEKITEKIKVKQTFRRMDRVHMQLGVFEQEAGVQTLAKLKYPLATSVKFPSHI